MERYSRLAISRKCRRWLISSSCLVLLLLAQWVSAASRPLVMLTMSRDDSLFFEAYPDNGDFDQDGVIETSYRDASRYDGYFHPGLCYRYVDSSQRCVPVASTDASDRGHYCLGPSSNAWSGNFLNWASMTRMDLVRRALYGGLRVVDDQALTVLERAHLPADATRPPC